jgi:C1A family cysteine protease
MNLQWAYGCHEDPPNCYGNWEPVFGANLQETPIACDYRSLVSDIPIANQWWTQSCVGHAMALAVTLCMRHKNSSFELVSALDTYDMALGNERLDVGTTLFSAADALSRYGWLLESECPWDPNKVPSERTSWTLRQRAWQRRGMKHHRVMVGVAEAIRSALSSDCGVVIGCDVGPEFENLHRDEIYAGEPVRLGGHAMTPVGYDSECLVVRNSWGEDWSENGYGRLAWDFVESGKVRSVWVIDSL